MAGLKNTFPISLIKVPILFIRRRRCLLLLILKLSLLIIPYPSAYFRKFLTDEQKEKRSWDLIAQEIKRWIAPTELEKLKTIADVESLIAQHKLADQYARDNEREAKRRLFLTTFGDPDARRVVDDNEAVFGLPSDTAGLDSPSQVVATPPPETDLVIGEIPCDESELSSEARQAIYDCRVAINAKIQSDWHDFLLREYRLELLFSLLGLIRSNPAG
ncbi:MAG: hypothetical protein LE178_03825 [Endomicrobium sp.]|nr:hypothetical protein [Endomicrobium sp.]